MTDIVERLRESALEWGQEFALLGGELDEAIAEIERLRAALEISQSWLDRWTTHIGTCKGADQCTCGLTRVQFDVAEALENSKL